jgi:ElaB/YqjD/DUF883 family membrane-anchored ribosome-binding protein
MDMQRDEQEIQQRLDALMEHLATIRRNHEQILAENKRLREVARLAEGELRKRREQIERLQLERQNIENKSLDAKARIEHTIEKLDMLVAENARQQS